jgi:glycosyltransferase involved in cell wall biosynthesis
MKESQYQQNGKKIAIVHDFLLYPGGAEKVLFDLTRIFPDAPVYTLLHDSDRMGDFLHDRDIRTSFLQQWPHMIRKRYRYLLPFFGTAVESFDLRDFDLIISSSGAWSKGIVTRLNTKHVAYIHSPMRYVWDENEHYIRKSIARRRGFCVRILLSYLRLWDHQAAQRPDALIANSLYTQKRIAKYYRRDAAVIYPAVMTEKMKNIQKKDHFVIVSRLSAYKNIALAVEVCNKLQLPLIVIGQGREEKELKKMAGETIVFKGWVSEEEKLTDIASARAFLFPSEEDFGIAPVEALRVGTPVIALSRGGVSETVVNSVTGELFTAPTVEMMSDAVRRFLEKEHSYDRERIIESVSRFTFTNFKSQILDVVNKMEN